MNINQTFLRRQLKFTKLYLYFLLLFLFLFSYFLFFSSLYFFFPCLCLNTKFCTSLELVTSNAMTYQEVSILMLKSGEYLFSLSALLFILRIMLNLSLGVGFRILCFSFKIKIINFENYGNFLKKFVLLCFLCCDLVW